MKAGMQGYITKPLDVPTLVRELQVYRAPADPDTRPSSLGVSQRDDLASLPALACIDLRRALAHVDGSPALLLRTLRGFTQAYGQGIEAWQGWLDGAQWDELHRAAHTLQGLAGTIGALPLRERAQQLERHALSRDAARADESLDTLSGLLADLVAQIDNALQPAPADASTSQFGELELTPAEALNGLRELLEQSDGEVSDWWHTHRRALRQTLTAPTMRSVGLAIQSFDFDAALAALPALPASSSAVAAVREEVQ